MKKHEVLEKIIEALGVEPRVSDTDYDDNNDGIGYITTPSGEFRITVERI